MTGRVRKQTIILGGAEEPEEGHGVKERAYGKRKGRWLFCMCFSYVYSHIRVREEKGKEDSRVAEKLCAIPSLCPSHLAGWGTAVGSNGLI